MKHAYSILLILGLTSASLTTAFGQKKEVTTQKLVWFRYYNKIVFNKDWSLSTEIEDRRYAFPDRQHQLLLPRVTLTRKLGSGWEVGAGGVYFLQSLPEDASKDIDLTRPEIRPHQEFSYKQEVSKNFQISHRYRLEERFVHKTSGTELAPGYNFNFRLRYQLQFAWPIIKSADNTPKLTLKVFDELMVNIGNKIVRNVFDQNRAGLGFNYSFSKSLQLQADFLNWFQERSNGDQFYSRYIGRFTLYHTLTLHQNEKKTN